MFFFFFALRRRIQHGLKRKIQCLCARLMLAAGTEHLNVGRLDTHVFRQPRLAEFLYSFHGCGRVAAAQEEKVPVGGREHRQFTLIDCVGIHDDEASLCLPEDFGQADSLHHAAADEVGKYVSCTDGRQLIRVADQKQAAAGLECLQKRRHKLQIHHRCFIHNHRVTGKRCVFVVKKSHAARRFVKLCLQKPVDS